MKKTIRISRQMARCSRGAFLTLDVASAMLLLFLSIVVALSYYSAPGQQTPSFSGHMLRTYAQDASTVMIKKGSLSLPLSASNSSDTSGIREVLQATPPSVCMEVAAYGTAVPDGLVGYWKLDEDSGLSVADSSGNGNAGRIISNSTRGPQFMEDGRSRRALNFEYNPASGSYANVSHSALLSPAYDITVAAWFRTTGIPIDLAAIVEKLNNSGTVTRGYALRFTAAGSSHFTVKTSSGSSTDFSISNTVADGKWHFLVGTYDSGNRTVRIYLDGSLQLNNSTGASGAIVQGSDPLLIGKGAWTNYPRYFNGSIDEVRVYNRALSASEVRQLYSNPANLQYIVSKQDCTYAGGDVQSLTVPFSYSKSQEKDGYYYAVIRSWMKGVR